MIGAAMIKRWRARRNERQIALVAEGMRRMQDSMDQVVAAALRDVAAEVARLRGTSQMHYKAGDLYIAVKTDEQRATHRK